MKVRGRNSNPRKPLSILANTQYMDEDNIKADVLKWSVYIQEMTYFFPFCYKEKMFSFIDKFFSPIKSTLFLHFFIPPKYSSINFLFALAYLFSSSFPFSISVLSLTS